MDDKAWWLNTELQDGTLFITAGGSFTVEFSREYKHRFDRIQVSRNQQTVFNFEAIERIDTTGAMLINSFGKRLGGFEKSAMTANDNVISILSTVNRYQKTELAEASKRNFIVSKIESIGKSTLDAVNLVACFVVFIGEITSLILSALFRPSRFRLGQMIQQIELSGLNAIPIIVLISFLIGIVVAYQGAVQLGKLGADVYTVDLLGVTILRELGILLAAVVIAGRSGSTFAAELGSMKLNQELDAMRTIGINPIEMLVLPRVLGLIISLPILTLLANFFGICGGCLMIWVLLDISPQFFIIQFMKVLSPWTFWVGMLKAPVFAAIIAVIGCYEGLQVSGSAESLGKHTTRAVVESIFFIIVFDALFSIFFGVLGI